MQVDEPVDILQRHEPPHAIEEGAEPDALVELIDDVKVAQDRGVSEDKLNAARQFQRRGHLVEPVHGPTIGARTSGGNLISRIFELPLIRASVDITSIVELMISLYI